MSESGNRNDVPADRGPDIDKVIQELKDMEMYEEGLSPKELTEFLQVLKDSMAKPGSQSSITDKVPEPRQVVHQPSHSQTGNKNSSMPTRRISVSPDLSSNQHNSNVCQENGAESSDEVMFFAHCRNSFDKNKSKASKDASANINKVRNAINEITNEPTNENRRMNARTNSQLKNEDRIARWKIDPFDFVVDDKDKPLISRFHGSSNRNCASTRTLDDINKDITRMSLHLKKVSEACRNQRWSNVQPNNPWGTAIKVGTANENSDVEAVADDATEEAKEASDEPDENAINKIMNSKGRRACVQKVDPQAYKEADNKNSEDELETRQKKRKLTVPDESNEKSRSSRDANLNLISENLKRPKYPVRGKKDHWADEFLASSDEDNAEKPTRRKKAKISNANKATLLQSSSKTKSVELVSTDESRGNSIEKEAAEEISIDDSDEVTICESATAGQSRNRLKRSESPEATASAYPRRIVPPNPRGKYSGLRVRRPLHPNASRINRRYEQDNEDDAEVAKTMSRGRGRGGLQDDEIVEQLENNVEEINEFSLVEPSTIVPLRPSSRLKLQSERLRAERQKEAEAESIKREAERTREEETSRRKIERVKERVKEEAEKTKLEELNEKRKSAAERTWRERMRNREKQRQMERIELNPEGPRQANDIPTVEVEPEHHFEMEQRRVEVIDDNKRGNHEQPEQLTCPICSQDFPVREIENHAASCEAYEAGSSAGRSRSNSPIIPRSSRNAKHREEPSRLWTCDICLKFTARNGKEFEDHVHSCIARVKYGVDDGTGSIVPVPDSPIRTVRKNSEQTDSEINYADQLRVPKSRSNVNYAGKRKRR